jgi:uncharacterized RDD family membrane protein YckC
MKCPKCGYLGFENLEQCRNCGYRFSLTAAVTTPPPELPLRQGARVVVEPLDDLELIDIALAKPEARPMRDDVTPPARTVSTGSRRNAPEPEDLPLFGETPRDETPLITRASAPRTPLSVRRATPEVPRLRTETKAPLPNVVLPGLDQPMGSLLHVVRPHLVTEPAPIRVRVGAPVAQTASLAQRAAASALDLAVIATVDLLVLYFTMQISGLVMGDLALLPMTPLIGFLVVQNVSYFIVFTAGGQTLGKMVIGLRVVDVDQNRPPSLSRAAIRTCAWIVMAMPAGLGLLTAKLDADERALHDRVARTRVIRVAA